MQRAQRIQSKRPVVLTLNPTVAIAWVNHFRHGTVSKQDIHDFTQVMYAELESAVSNYEADERFRREDEATGV